MKIPPSALWQTDLPDDIDQQLAELFTTSEGLPAPVRIFFRADDIGRIDSNFIQMMELFTEYDMPLCPALVPTWLSGDSWQQISALADKENLFCWHQHGFSHVNHEQLGKKCEFGEHRSTEAIRQDILTGRIKLEQFLSRLFLPVFTPPWNRCSATTMQILQELGFSALSRSTNVQPLPPAGLPDLMINIDLHTRRETDPQQGTNNLMAECRAALQSGRMGFMLHHQHMNPTAFLFLEHLFQAIKASPDLAPCTFRELLQES